MKYIVLTILFFWGQILTAQESIVPSSESFRFYKAKPNAALKRSYKLNLRALVPPKKAPVLLVKPVKKATKNVWKSKKSYSKAKTYQKNALTIRYNLREKASLKTKFSVDESSLVQAFLPMHPFVLTQKAKKNLAKASMSPSVNIANVDLIRVEMPKKPKNTIYPNPTSGVFNIQLEEDATEIKVVNLIGHVVLSKKVIGRSFYGLDISHLPKGTYIASFLQREQWFSQRIVLVK